MAEPNGYIEGSNGERIEIVDSAARESLKTKLPAPKKAKAGDYLRISAINEDSSMLVEAVSAPGVELPTEATFAHITLETAQTADGECGVIIHPEGTEDVPELTFYGMRGDEAVRLNNVADAIDDRSVPNLGQVKKLVEKNGNDSGQNPVQGIGITTIMAITQAEYDELAMLGQVDETTLYIIKPESEDGPDMTMIPVLRSDGVAWIDLGIAAPAGAWYEVCFRGISDMDTYDALFGNGHTYVGTAGGGLTYTWITGYYAGSSYATFGSGTIDISTKHTFAVTNTALILDGATENAKAITAGAVTYKNPLYLFARNAYTNDSNRTDNVSGISAIDFFYLRIWSSENKLLHNYIPAKDSDGVACIYDTVDKAYLYNAAEAGAFEYREELEES